MLKKTNILLLIASICSLLLVFLVDIQAIGFIVFIITISMVGIPHGAIDHIVYFKKTNITKGRFFSFYAYYIGLMIFVATCWIYFPVFSFLIFLTVSAYHFGQSQIFYIRKCNPIKHFIFFCWGSFVLSTIITLNFTECSEIFSSLQPLKSSQWMVYSIWWWLMIGSGLTLSVFYFILYFNKSLTYRELIFEIIVLLILITLSYYASAVYTFAIYFGLWHSLRSLIIEYKSLNASGRYSAVEFIRAILPFSLLALIFLLISYYITENYIPGLSAYMLFIIVVSTLTLPHLIVMHDLYDNFNVKLSKR
ncbi:MAG: Brp/Blh family beta-carotene 15,15'-dioxygenase [Fulvivirga sp.]|nr:Brp/Blh family beta-carotene 15,15'-dioxygenase [Fulvivirga sp.]